MPMNPNEWQARTCMFCGDGPEAFVYVQISLGLEDIGVIERAALEEDGYGEFPFTDFTMCRRCFDEHGLTAAFNHNNATRGDLGIPRVCPMKVMNDG